MDRTRLAQHLARVDGIFDREPGRGRFVRWTDQQAARRLIASDPEVLVPAVIAAAAIRVETDPDDYPAVYFVNAESIADRVVGRRLHVDPRDAVLMLELAANPHCWYYEVRVALHLAERALDAHPGHPDVIEALVTLRDRLAVDRLHSSGFFSEKVRPWLSRLLAGQAPGGLLDLSFVSQRGAWGRAAALAISHVAEDEPDAGLLALHLASPRGTRAAKAWWAETARWAEQQWARDLVSELTGYLATVDLTPRDEELDGWDAPLEHLVVPDNIPLARGAVWAESFALDDEAAERVADAVLRSGSTWRGPGGQAAICSKVALAGILTLSRLDTDAAAEELTRLYEELTVPALIRGAGKSLGIPEVEIKARIRDGSGMRS